jgi:glucosamine 6-phosphate synthetase-like amidotransferase/phosphosugar isomerase protein
MCGIAGITFLERHGYTVGGYSYNEKKVYVDVFKDMLVDMQSRGTDATGVFSGKLGTTASSKGSVCLFKSDDNASKYLKLKNADKILDTFFSGIDTLYFVGHTRGATSGSARDNRNNHPFKCGPIIGVHNGIIHNYSKIREKAEIELTGSCDSESIFSLIRVAVESKCSLEDGIVSAAEVLEGWYACVAVDTSNFREIAFFRQGAPLEFLYCHEDHTLVYASTMDCIRHALDKNKLGHKKFEEFELPNGAGMVIDTTKTKGMEDAGIFSLEDGTTLENTFSNSSAEKKAVSEDPKEAATGNLMRNGGTLFM